MQSRVPYVKLAQSHLLSCLAIGTSIISIDGLNLIKDTFACELSVVPCFILFFWQRHASNNTTTTSTITLVFVVG
jgi:hypothetical protein